MTSGSAVLLAVAGFLAGSVNAVAGGGSLISFPALIATGLPALTANVTNTVSVWPGYLGSTAAYRRELVSQRHRLARLGITGATGAIAGSIVLLVAPESVFDAIVPILIVAACALLAFQPRIAAAVTARENRRPRTSNSLQLHGSVFLAATYGAYFGGGLGVILLAVLGIFVADHIQQTNALKTAVSLVVNTVALLIFALFTPVAWSAVAIVAPASLIGGYLGGGVARKLSAGRLRAVVIVFGLVVAVWLIVD